MCTVMEVCRDIKLFLYKDNYQFENVLKEFYRAENFPPFGSFLPFLNSTDRFYESSRHNEVFFDGKVWGGW